MVDYRYAACRLAFEDELDLFFPERGKPATPAIRRFCNGCEIRAECLEDNLLEPHGVYGGMSAKQRERLRGKLRLQPMSRRQPWDFSSDPSAVRHRRARQQRALREAS